MDGHRRAAYGDDLLLFKGLEETGDGLARGPDHLRDLLVRHRDRDAHAAGRAAARFVAPGKKEVGELLGRRVREAEGADLVGVGLALLDELPGDVERDVTVLAHEAEEVVAFDELELGRRHGLGGRLVRVARQDAGEAEGVAGHDAAGDQLLAGAGGDGQLGRAVAEDEEPARRLPFREEQRPLGIDICEGDGVEGLERVRVELTKKAVVAPRARETTFAHFHSIPGDRSHTGMIP